VSDIGWKVGTSKLYKKWMVYNYCFYTNRYVPRGGSCKTCLYDVAGMEYTY